LSGFALLFIGFAAFRILMFYHVLPGIDPRFTFDLNYPYVNFIRVNFLWFLQHAFFGVAYFAYKKNLDTIKKNAELERSIIELEYAFLRSQFNPHFLFNTLSYIYTKALPLSEDMADAVIRLAWMMRYSLKKGGSDQKVFLAEELEYVGHFIQLQNLRRNGNAYIDFHQKGTDSNKRVAPLVLASLVENAFKHGKLNDPSFPLQILVEVHTDKIEIFVKNKKSQLKDYVSHGIGNQNLKRRLELVYPGMHRLDIINDPQFYECHLIIYEKDASQDFHENLYHTDLFFHH
jgi:sensor histidine kinase YesM